MNVFVIGGSGFTGRRVLAQASPEWCTYALARSARSERIVAESSAVSVRGDLDDPISLQRALELCTPELVICVASLGFGHAGPLIAALERAGSPRTVFTSTTGVFTALNPASKQVRLQAEALIEASDLPYSIVRPTMIYGRPGDRNMERLLRTLRRVPFLPAPMRGRALQQPVHVDDLATALIAAGVREEAIGRSINVPGPIPLTFAEVVRLAGDAVGRRATVLPVPVKPLRAAVSLQERVLPHPRLKNEQIDRLVEDKTFDPNDAVKFLDHRPRAFAIGIQQEAGLLGLP